MIGLVEAALSVFNRQENEEADHYLTDSQLNRIAGRLKEEDGKIARMGQNPRTYYSYLLVEGLFDELVSQIYNKDPQLTAQLETFGLKKNEGRIKIQNIPKELWADRDQTGIAIEYDPYADCLTRVKTVLFREGIREDFIKYPQLRQKISDAMFNAINDAR